MPNGAEHIKKKLPEHVPPVQAAGGHRHHQGADGGRPDDALHHGRRPRRRRHADVDRARACSPPASARPACTAPTGWAATRCPTCSCSASAPASTRRSSRSEHGAATIDAGAGRRGGAARRSRRSSAARAGGEGPYQVQYELQEMMQDLVGIVRNEAEMEQALDGDRAARKRARRKVGVGGNREYNPGWHTALDLHNLLTVSEAIARCGHRAQGEPRRPLPRRLPRQGRRRSRRSTSSSARRPDGGMRAAARADPRRCATS